MGLRKRRLSGETGRCRRGAPVPYEGNGSTSSWPASPIGPIDRNGCPDTRAQCDQRGATVACRIALFAPPLGLAFRGELGGHCRVGRIFQPRGGSIGLPILLQCFVGLFGGVIPGFLSIGDGVVGGGGLTSCGVHTVAHPRIRVRVGCRIDPGQVGLRTLQLLVRGRLLPLGTRQRILRFVQLVTGGFHRIIGPVQGVGIVDRSAVHILGLGVCLIGLSELTETFTQPQTGHGAQGTESSTRDKTFSCRVDAGAAGNCGARGAPDTTTYDIRRELFTQTLTNAQPAYPVGDTEIHHHPGNIPKLDHNAS
ncbi:hypothetical protein [Nocardia carnea]|uniref:hypothetical protein n=1 Tax=Nocardia carnea TaxID=37328 RepID=UPI002455CD63|nr:hypothetical protein [Nocardia carnea]